MIYARLATEADLAPFAGKLRGKWVMLDTAQAADPHFAGDACRFDADQLAGMTRTETEFNCRTPAARQIATADSAARVRDSLAKLGVAPGGRGGRGGGRGGFGGAQGFQQQLAKFLLDEGALGTLRSGAGRYGDGTVAVQGGRGPSTIPTTGIPNISIAAEHYGRMYRTIQKGIPVTLEVNAKVAFTPDTGSFNIVGEIPGSDARAQGRSRHARRAFRLVGRRNGSDGQRGRLGDHARGDAYFENSKSPHEAHGPHRAMDR